MKIVRNVITCDYYDNITLDDISDITLSDCDYQICRVNAVDYDMSELLKDNGFYLTDLRLDVKVKLKTLKESNAKKRFDISVYEQIENVESDVKVLFYNAFTMDRRFHLKRVPDQNLANMIIDSYIKEAISKGMIFVACRYKKKIIAAAFLEHMDEKVNVFLAGTLPEYQGSGVSVELYRFFADYAKARNAKILTGEISASNTSVMNLYANLGANFYSPRFLYVHEGSFL